MDAECYPRSVKEIPAFLRDTANAQREAELSAGAKLAFYIHGLTRGRHHSSTDITIEKQKVDFYCIHQERLFDSGCSGLFQRAWHAWQ